MKVFVATRTGQETRQSDFCDAEEGELLTFAIECGRDEENHDGQCGCRRSLLGLESGGISTTFTVAEIPMTSDCYEQKVIEYFSARGWFAPTDNEAIEIFLNDAQILLAQASLFAIGVVLEKRGDKIQVRQPITTSTAFMTARWRHLSQYLSVAK